MRIQLIRRSVCALLLASALLAGCAGGNDSGATPGTQPTSAAVPTTPAGGDGGAIDEEFPLPYPANSYPEPTPDS
ncbi:MAG TPA: hypothetical protein VFS21_11165 [Roseiflexaceae bacterium]|nr:hypothetical protein [Roseiflexaceae bacterium]